MKLKNPMKTDLKNSFRNWFESTRRTEPLRYRGRAQKPEEQAKYDAARLTENGIPKTIHALLVRFSGLSKIWKVSIGIAVFVILFFDGTYANRTRQKYLQFRDEVRVKQGPKFIQIARRKAI
jgi:hypothetical protein